MDSSSQQQPARGLQPGSWRFNVKADIMYQIICHHTFTFTSQLVTYDVSTLPSALQVACCFSPSNFMPSWHLKVITALRLVLLPSNQPLGKRPLLGQPQLISTHSGWPPDHSRSESHVLVWLGS